MHQIFVWECLCATSGFPNADAPPSLAREGYAMLRALVADFSRIPNVEVVTLCGPGRQFVVSPQCRVHVVADSDGESRRFDRLASAADWTLIVAPETGGVLLDRCRRVVARGGRLLGPSPDFVAIAADKHATACCLRDTGVTTPEGIALAPGERLPAGFAYPAVLKPRDGAGSQDMRLMERSPRNEIEAMLPSNINWRLERFCPGTPASIAMLCGPAGSIALPACRQHLSADGRFAYLGGSLPLSNDWQQRAELLARRAMAALPTAHGYIGLDIVLDAADDGTLDWVIEVNPRITTSYVGLRAAANFNLAEVMLAVAQGSSPKLSFRSGNVKFTPDGACTPISSV